MIDVDKYDIVLVDLDPTRGSEQRGVRPCLVLQNNQANKFARTTVVCTLTSNLKELPHTLKIEPSGFNNIDRESVIDVLQIKTIDKSRIIHKIGELDDKYRMEIVKRCIIAFDLKDVW